MGLKYMQRTGAILFAVLVIICVCLASGCRRSAQTPETIRRPGAGVILISLDTLRKDRLGAYGFPDSVSPFLDRFCRTSVVFEDVASQSASTWTSHRSVFLSRYVHDHPAGDPDPSETLAGRFRAAGYRTAAFVDGGKMHQRYGHAAGFDSYDDEGGHLAAIIPKVRDWLLDHRDRQPETPFFLFLHTYDIHAPYNPEDRDDRVFLGNTPVPPEFRTETPRYLNTLNLDRSQLELISRLYTGGVRSCDRRLATLFHFLAAEEFLEDTVIMIMSDHGESLGERNHLGHHEMYYVQLAVPLILHVPELASRIVPGTVENLDIMPTLLDITGNLSPGRFHGFSQTETIETGGIPMPDRQHLAENRERTIFRDLGWKLILNGDPSRDRLHNLAENPEETRNMLSEKPAEASALLKAMESVTGQTEAELRTPAARDLPVEIFRSDDRKLQEQLQMLGYIDK